jgi:cell wall-associated NlpC family hydrolase
MSMAARQDEWHLFQLVPFKDGGRDWQGVDCWGLIYLIYKEKLGIELPTYGWISATELLKVYEQIDQDKEAGGWTLVPFGGERRYDVIVMTGAMRREGQLRMAPVHVGMVIDSGKLIHIEENSGMVCMPFRDGAHGRANPLLKNRVKGIYRYRLKLDD